MKLIIQIPCLNEAETLPGTLADLPREVDGFDCVEWLIIDDGSTDKTVEVARKHGVDHVVQLPCNRGLARAFRAGLDACIRLGADVIVNTDGDNQYNGHDIPKLCVPILRGEADMVVGDRQTHLIEHFSPIKRKLQRWGSRVVSGVAQVNVPDTTSGFRAISRETALRLNLVNSFTYTLESIIQAGHSGMRVSHAVIGTNAKTRESRLFGSIPEYVRRSAGVIIRSTILYRPLAIFLTVGAALIGAGLILGGRFLYYFFVLDQGSGKVQSLILASALVALGGQVVGLGLLADLISSNRKLLEDTLLRLRRLESRTFANEGEIYGPPPRAAAHPTPDAPADEGEQAAT